MEKPEADPEVKKMVADLAELLTDSKKLGEQFDAVRSQTQALEEKIVKHGADYVEANYPEGCWDSIFYELRERKKDE